MGRKIPKKYKEFLYYFYLKRCVYCGREITFKEMEIDHVYPRNIHNIEEQDVNYRAISNNDNYVIACPDCNRLKSNRTADEFLQYVREDLLNDLHKNIKYRVALQMGIISEDKSLAENVMFRRTNHYFYIDK